MLTREAELGPFNFGDGGPCCAPVRGHLIVCGPDSEGPGHLIACGPNGPRHLTRIACRPELENLIACGPEVEGPGHRDLLSWSRCGPGDEFSECSLITV